MKSMGLIKCIACVLAALAIPGCALETELPGDEVESGDAAEEQPADDPVGEAQTETVEQDLAATPTCNAVINWSNAAVPARSGSVNCSMARGANSPAVQQLQRSMNICYGESLALDGDFGGRTRDALIRTQRRAGTPADGEYGPNTRRAMRHESNDVPGTCTRVP